MINHSVLWERYWERFFCFVYDYSDDGFIEDFVLIHIINSWVRLSIMWKHFCELSADTHTHTHLSYSTVDVRAGDLFTVNRMLHLQICNQEHKSDFFKHSPWYSYCSSTDRVYQHQALIPCREKKHKLIKSIHAGKASVYLMAHDCFHHLICQYLSAW